MTFVPIGIIRPPRLYGASLKTSADQIITFDATLNESPTFRGELTRHPVEVGGSVVDHFRRDPISLTMAVFVSNTPILADQ